jgi:hypothetical protein
MIPLIGRADLDMAAPPTNVEIGSMSDDGQIGTSHPGRGASRRQHKQERKEKRKQERRAADAAGIANLSREERVKKRRERVASRDASPEDKS